LAQGCFCSCGQSEQVADKCLINEKKKLLLKLVAIKTLRNASFIIVANTEIEMKEMMKNLRKYMTKNKLEVNVEKTKMMVFNKRKKKSEENEINSGKEGK
jgi:hypothetical protein